MSKLRTFVFTILFAMVHNQIDNHDTIMASVMEISLMDTFETPASETTDIEITTTSDSSSQSETESEATTTSTVSSETITTEELRTTETTTTEILSTTEMMTTEISDVFFSCDFSTACFDQDKLTLTNGSEFQINDPSQPILAPNSDVSSITLPTDNSEYCQIPFTVESVTNETNATDWVTWFCYNNLCRTDNETLGQCAPGKYAYAILDSQETNLNVSEKINIRRTNDSEIIPVKISFWYFVTFYADDDQGQQIQIYFGCENDTEVTRLVRTINIGSINGSRWQDYEIIVESMESSCILQFSFELTNNRGWENSTKNNSFYFALDNIEVIQTNETETTTTIQTTKTSTTPIQNTTEVVTTTTTTTTTEEMISDDDDLALTLGLSLGVGVPFLIIVIGFGIYFWTRSTESYSFQLSISKRTNMPDEVPLYDIASL